MSSRRYFLKQITAAGIAAAASPLVTKAESVRVTGEVAALPQSNVSKPGSLIVPKNRGLRITGTFLDEISHDIPHQNLGLKEWDRDFQYMKAIGIDTVIDIRCGYRKFITYPSEYLMKKHGCYMPSVDLIEMFCSLADKYDMKFYFGLYDSGHYWDTGDMSWEIDDNKYVIDEAWKRYGHHKSFYGWYISTEISRGTKWAVPAFH